jgi:hypothetical protein
MTTMNIAGDTTGDEIGNPDFRKELSNVIAILSPQQS